MTMTILDNEINPLMTDFTDETFDGHAVTTRMIGSDATGDFQGFAWLPSKAGGRMIRFASARAASHFRSEVTLATCEELLDMFRPVHKLAAGRATAFVLEAS